MAIKKRTLKPTIQDEPTQNGPLVIESKPKRPLPPGGLILRLCGPSQQPSAGFKRAIGPLAISCGDDPDGKLTVTDKVELLRTPYDDKSAQEMRYRNRIRNRGTAITALCITCQGTRKAVTECIHTRCPLWAFRLGSNPFYGAKLK